MAQIFLSHASRDDPSATAFAEWLRGEGWDDLFLEPDPDRGAAGERRERALPDPPSAETSSR